MTNCSADRSDPTRRRPPVSASAGRPLGVVLALVLLLGSVVGVQFGTAIGAKVTGPLFRVLLALMVLATAGKLLLDLVIEPRDLYSLQILSGGP